MSILWDIKGQLCTYRQPWEPSRTGVTCSALGKEGCSAVCPWNGDQGTGIRVRLCSEQSPSQHLNSVWAASGQNPASREWDRVLPAPQKGFGMDPCCRKHRGCTAEHTSMQRDWSSRNTEQGEPYLGARSTTRTRGTWQGLGTGAPSVTQPCLSPLPFNNKTGKSSP